jgi:hypothetical protein
VVTRPRLLIKTAQAINARLNLALDCLFCAWAKKAVRLRSEALLASALQALARCQLFKDDSIIVR